MSISIQSPSEQVAAYLRQQLFIGRWAQEFPGTPTLAAELGIDRKTITAAIKQLEKEGLLRSQGAGRPRKITLAASRSSSRLSIRFIPYEAWDLERPFMLEAFQRIRELGHTLTTTKRSLCDLGMDPRRIARYVKEQEGDAWIALAGSRAVLDWFASSNIPAFALFGRRRSVAIPSVGPDKIGAIRQVVQRLVELGHRRIVYLAREERRKPEPGAIEMEFLKELSAHGITTGEYNLPEWEDNPASFHACLDRLFQYTPPTAVILDEAKFMVAALQHLSTLNIAAPRDVSLICSDSHPLLDWCDPKVSHIRWQKKPVVNHIVHWVQQLSLGINDERALYTPAEFIEGGTIGPVPR